MKIKKTDWYVFFAMSGIVVLLASLFFFAGFGIGGDVGVSKAWNVEVPASEVACRLCPEEDHLRCIVDHWASEYIAGRCEK